MERKIIVATHGDAANGITDSVRMILGEIKVQIETFTLKPGENTRDFVETIKTEIEQNKNTEYVILTDLYGASVCSSMYSLVVFENVWLFSGVNVGMLLLICVDYPNKLSSSDADKIVKDTCNGIRYLKHEKEIEEDF
ncbi:PTS sugar transporter subunit IIA [Amedibacillus sp. YH-ame6]